MFVKTQKDKLEKYGRVLGTLQIIPPKVKAKKLKKGEVAPPPVEPMTVNDLLVKEGHALPWDGKGVRPV